MSKAKAIKWTEAHRREARARLYQIAAEMLIAGLAWSHAVDVAMDGSAAVSEPGFRACLRHYGEFDPARIDREVRRVDGLATGRLVRETVWAVRKASGITVPIGPGVDGDDGGAGACRAAKAESCQAAVRVTRIRKARP